MIHLVENPADLPIAISLRDIVSKLGMIFGAVLVGYLIEFVGFQTTFFIMAGVLCVGAVMFALAKRIP
jgi:predicted MFS family arabinose efflux permease